MKKYLITLSAILILVINMAFHSYNAIAQDEITTPTEAEKECEDKKPALLEKDEEDILIFKNIKTLESKIDSGEIEFSYTVFEEEFEKVQEEYHTYVDCIFGFAEKKILGAVGLSKGTMQANTPNFIDWMIPKAACLEYDSDELKEVKKATASDALVPVLTDMHEIYADYLQSLVVMYEFEGRETRVSDEELKTGGLSVIDQLSATSAAYTGIDRIVKTETENALVAMDIAFKSLKELRASFFMHVQFQCMLNNLEEYRQWLGRIRTIVEGMAGRLKDCSMVK